MIQRAAGTKETHGKLINAVNCRTKGIRAVRQNKSFHAKEEETLPHTRTKPRQNTPAKNHQTIQPACASWSHSPAVHQCMCVLVFVVLDLGKTDLGSQTSH